MYSLCLIEGQAGNCGLTCRGFLEKECSIVEEMIYEYPITWEQFEEAKLTYPNLEGTEMHHINKLIITQMRRHAVEMEMLLAIQEVPWENLKVDEPVYVGDNLETFCSGEAVLAHFSGVTDKRFEVFSEGRSSTTFTRKHGYFFCLPKTIYNETKKYVA